MNLKSHSLLILLVVLVFPLKGQCPLSSDVVVDGVVDEWTMPWEVDEDKKFSYNVCADDQNMYVRVKTSDFYTMRKMAAFGFTLWFDLNGKKKRVYGLKFPVGGSEADERIAQLEKESEGVKTTGERTDFQKRADEVMVSNLEILELIGLSDDPITSTRSGITNGIKVAIALDQAGAYVYEAIVPFRSYRLSPANSKEISFGFETGKYVPPKEKPTTASAIRQEGITTKMLSRMQGYKNMQGDPRLIHPTTAWTKLALKK